MRLWDNADAINEHHEHEHRQREGKQSPIVLDFESSNEAMAAAISKAKTEDPEIGSGDRETMAAVMSNDANIDPATERVLASIDDEQLAARYPNRTHFISADNPHQGEMATRALFEGDPVAIVYPDGHELLIHPEEVHGLARLPLAVAAVLLKVRRGDLRDLMQLPPRTRIEARDSAGHPIAA